MQRLCTILICLYLCGVIKAQDPYFHFNEFTAAEIKLNSSVISGYQDHLGYLWFCGFDGISRYNGAEFESIESFYPQTSEIEIKHFRSIYIDSDYTAWLCSYGSGLFVVSNSGEMTNFDSMVPKDQRFPSKVISDVAVFDNQVWVLGEFGLRVYKKNGIAYELHTIESIPNQDNVKEIFSFENGTIWIRDDKNVHRYKISSNDFKTFEGFQKSKVSKDQFENTWILNRDNGNYLYKLDNETDLFVKSKNQPFSTINKSLTLAWDNHNRVWASQFNNQIYMGDMNTGKLVMTDNDQNSLKFPQFVRQPLVDNSGSVWFFNSSCYMLPYSCGFDPLHFDATNEKYITSFYTDNDYTLLGVQGEGLIVYNQSRKTYKKYTESNSDLADGHISFVRKLEDGKFAVGLVNYFQLFDVKKGFLKTVRTKGVVRSLLEDEDYYWVGGLIDMVRISKKDFTKKHFKANEIEGRPRNSIHQLIPKDDTHLWVFGAANGVLLFNKESEKFTEDPILTNRKDAPRVFSKITDADENDNKDYLVIATESGLYLYAHQTKELNVFDIGQEYIYTAQFQNDTILWASINNSLLRCNCLTLKCKKYGKHYGLINETFKIRSRYKSPNGEIYFGGDKGIDIAPVSPILINQKGPSLQVRKIIVNRKVQVNIDGDNVSDISPGAKIAEIYVDAIHPSHKDAVDIEYKYLDDSNWNSLKFGEQLTLINPQRGMHSIEFRAHNSDGVYNENNVIINIDFLEIWYESSWFKWLVGVFLLGVLLLGIWVYNLQKRKRLEKRYELTEEINQLKLQALNAQMNPHFVFNAMSSIQQMIGAKDNKIAMTYLSKFSRLLRHVINYSTDTTVSLDDELKFIENYLQLEQARFEDLFDYTINIDETIDPSEIEIPTFFIQPQIENAIKHGIRNSTRKGVIKLGIKEVDDFIVIEIEDNGIGRKKSKLINSMSEANTNKGIELTQKRVRQLNQQGYKTTYNIEDLTDNENNALGTLVILKFKIRNN